MIQTNPICAENVKEENLPRQDWILLPMIGMPTIYVLAVSKDGIARRVFSVSTTLMANCMVLNDPSTGARGIPNSACWETFPESQPLEYKFNNCALDQVSTRAAEDESHIGKPYDRK